MVETIGNLVLQLLVVAFGAFAGAWTAFRFEARLRRIEKTNRETEIGQRALMILGTRINLLNNYKTEVLVKYEKDEFGWALLLPVGLSAVDHHKLNVTDLNFLSLENDRQLLLELAVEDERFWAAIQAIKMRNSFRINYIDPVVMTLPKYTSSKDFVAAFNPKIVEAAKRYTDYVYEHVYLTLDSHIAIIERLFNALKGRFPEKRFQVVDVSSMPQKIDTPGTQTNS